MPPEFNAADMARYTVLGPWVTSQRDKSYAEAIRAALPYLRLSKDEAARLLRNEDPAFTEDAAQRVLDEAASGSGTAAHEALNTRSQAVGDAVGDNALVRGLQIARNLERAGHDPKEVVDVLRGGAMATGLPSMSPAQRVDAGNKKSVAPFDLKGGAVFNRYSGDLGDETQANQALAGQRTSAAGAFDSLAQYRAAKTADLNARSAAVQEIIQNPETSPLVRADVANSKTVSKPEMVHVQRADGTQGPATAVRNLSGGFDYEASDTPLNIVPKGSQRTHTLDRSPARLWQDSIKEAQSNERLRYLDMANEKDQARLHDAALYIYRQKMNDPAAEPPKNSAAPPPAPAPKARAKAVPGNVQTPDISTAREQQVWRGTAYSLGQEIPGADGAMYQIVGFYPDGEPAIEPVEE